MILYTSPNTFFCAAFVYLYIATNFSNIVVSSLTLCQLFTSKYIMLLLDQHTISTCNFHCSKNWHTYVIVRVLAIHRKLLPNGASIRLIIFMHINGKSISVDSSTWHLYIQNWEEDHIGHRIGRHPRSNHRTEIYVL